jgi:catechol 2,3-dioxygenase-like lactoylglutathione lyase family enzyme
VTAAPPFGILGLDHLLLHVRGMEEAERFYCDVIGCKVATRMAKRAMIELKAGSSSIVLVDTSDPRGAWALEGARPGRNLDHFALAAGPVGEAAMRAWLGENEVEIEEERAEEGELSFYVRDPSGNLVELLMRC